MSTPSARPHGHLSNRAKVRSALERRLVSRGVLENPFQLPWPSVPVNVQNAVLARLVAALENVPVRISSRKSAQKTGADTAVEHSNIPQSPHLVIGINAVTRLLEAQLPTAPKRVVADDPPRPAPSPVAVVCVCCADVDPPALVDHIPHLVAACNSPSNVAQPIKLVPLPKGAEPAIAQMLGVRRAAVVAFPHDSPLSDTVQDTLQSIPIVRAPWLCPSDTRGTPQLVPTHVKQLRTTAPRDMKGAREQRSKARAAAKKSASTFSRMHTLRGETGKTDVEYPKPTVHAASL